MLETTELMSSFTVVTFPSLAFLISKKNCVTLTSVTKNPKKKEMEPFGRAVTSAEFNRLASWGRRKRGIKIIPARDKYQKDYTVHALTYTCLVGTASGKIRPCKVCTVCPVRGQREVQLYRIIIIKLLLN